MSTIKFLAKQLAQANENIKALDKRIALLTRTNDTQYHALMERNDEVSRLRDDIGTLRSRVWAYEELEQSTLRQKRAGMSAREVDGMDKIPAIKYIRETYGYGLKEAKDVVDQWISNGALTQWPQSSTLIWNLARPE